MAAGRRADWAPQEGRNAGAQFANAEGLSQVVVRADLEPEDSLGFLRTGRQHQDGTRRPRRRNSRQISKPSFPGSMTSSTMASNVSSRARFKAASPSCSTATAIAFSRQIVLERQARGRARLRQARTGVRHDISSPPGSSSVNVLPRPGSLSRRISPPCAATIC